MQSAETSDELSASSEIDQQMILYFNKFELSYRKITEYVIPPETFIEKLVNLLGYIAVSGILLSFLLFLIGFGWAICLSILVPSILFAFPIATLSIKLRERREAPNFLKSLGPGQLTFMKLYDLRIKLSEYLKVDEPYRIDKNLEEAQKTADSLFSKSSLSREIDVIRENYMYFRSYLDEGTVSKIEALLLFPATTTRLLNKQTNEDDKHNLLQIIDSFAKFKFTCLREIKDLNNNNGRKLIEHRESYLAKFSEKVRGIRLPEESPPTNQVSFKERLKLLRARFDESYYDATFSGQLFRFSIWFVILIVFSWLLGNVFPQIDIDSTTFAGIIAVSGGLAVAPNITRAISTTGKSEESSEDKDAK